MSLDELMRIEISVRLILDGEEFLLHSYYGLVRAGALAHAVGSQGETVDYHILGFDPCQQAWIGEVIARSLPE